MSVISSTAAPGAHLVTSSQPSRSGPGLVSFLLSTFGCVQFFVGAFCYAGSWLWLDNDSSNLGCTATDCGLWWPG